MPPMSQTQADAVKTASFVIRISLDGGSAVTGTVERVATGAKQRVSGFDAIGPVIERMLAADVSTNRQ